jgi:ubiquitin carboxyl-terminal hydrolase 34
MDQDSRTDESRERALSSEPSSTRPNPFDDDDNLSARKRRRTSLSGSRSTSVETTLSQDIITIAAAASGIHPMKVDTPEPTLPSTPARSEHPAEPVSSKVTINLRNVDLEATPTSPTSPTPSRQRAGRVRASVEADEVDMGPTRSVEDALSPSSVFDSSEAAVVVIDDMDDDDVQFSTTTELLPAFPRTELSSIVSRFPWGGVGESPQDTVSRLSNFFRQRESPGAQLYGELISDYPPEPVGVDDAIFPSHAWLNKCLSYARLEFRTTVIEVYRENRAFWSVLPELFYHFSSRYGYLFEKALVSS